MLVHQLCEWLGRSWAGVRLGECLGYIRNGMLLGNPLGYSRKNDFVATLPVVCCDRVALFSHPILH
jgi:hypothetical protein